MRRSRQKDVIRIRKHTAAATALLIVVLGLMGCGSDVAADNMGPEETVNAEEEAWADTSENSDGSAEEEAWAASEEEAAVGTSSSSQSKAVTVVVPEILEPEPSGSSVKSCDTAVIDYSHTSDCYVMVQFTQPTNKKLKAQVKGPATTYTYDVIAQRWETFPLSEGDGEYTVTVYENIQDKQYATVVSETFHVTLTDEFAPFIRPNQFVDYSPAKETVKKAAELTAGRTGTIEKVTAVYNFVIRTLSYDTELAQTVQSGYLPVLDDVLERKKGICFDYAAVMTGMLRSQGIPCKLVVGFAGEAYHAWISVWSDEAGWIERMIEFDGKTWSRMDPTFASSAKNAAALKQYIGDNSNYEAKFYY